MTEVPPPHLWRGRSSTSPGWVMGNSFDEVYETLTELNDGKLILDPEIQKWYQEGGWQIPKATDNYKAMIRQKKAILKDPKASEYMKRKAAAELPELKREYRKSAALETFLGCLGVLALVAGSIGALLATVTS